MGAETDEALFEVDERIPLAIATIRVKDLHGKFDYTIDLGPEGALAQLGSMVAVNEERVTLLYGNNGSGKTSLLRLVFHGLSPAPNRGHRTAIYGTRFSLFEIVLTDGTHVSYVRTDGRQTDAYRAEVQRPSDVQPIVWAYHGPETRGPIRAGEIVYTTSGEIDPQTLFSYGESAFEEGQFIQALQELDINPVFLGDSRAIVSDVVEDEYRRARSAQQQGRPVDLDRLVQRQRSLDVDEALELAQRYLRQLAFTGTQAGSQRVDSVYVNVATAIAQHASKAGRRSKKLIPELRKRIQALDKRARRFNEYGLLPEFPADALDELLATAPDSNGPVLRQVLNPYLEGLDERMDALEAGLQAVASFVDALNGFLEGKRVEFRVGTQGIRIVDVATNELIRPPHLSSGEKQIVLLFSDIIALQERTRLFIIDEPELSLNPQWQRMLVPSLLGVTQPSGMQLLAATHSIEIMAKYRRRIRRLEEQGVGGSR